MNGCYNCRYKNKDLASKTCSEYVFRLQREANKVYCMNWKKEHWWQKIIRRIKERLK